MVGDKEVKLWERQKGEPTKIYSYFCSYRDLGPNRNLRELPQKLGKSLTIIGKHSSKYNWVERVKAWEDYQDKINRKSQEEEIRKMAKRHADIALGMQSKAIDKLRNLDINEMKPADIARFIEEGVRIERLSRGVPDQIIQELGEITVRWKKQGEKIGDSD